MVPGFGRGAGYGLYRYRSADGINWRPQHGPLDIASDDTLYVHRDPDGTYVSHHKRSIPNYPGGHTPYDVDPAGSRSAFAATSADGAHWQPSALAMTPDRLDRQGDQIMELGRHPYHGGFVGITAVYHSRHQEMDLQVAASPDGSPLSWWRPARRPCLPLAPLGEYGGGLIWPTRTLVEDGDRWVLFHGATEGLHGDVYARDESVLLFHGAFCRASWRKGRMWAAVPAAGGAQEASLTTSPAGAVRGRQLIVNVVTRPGGQLRCELLRDGSPVPGYDRADCVPVSGDETCAPVRWRAGVRCPADGLALRLYLRAAHLYGFAWRKVAWSSVERTTCGGATVTTPVRPSRLLRVPRRLPSAKLELGLRDDVAPVPNSEAWPTLTAIMRANSDCDRCRSLPHRLMSTGPISRTREGARLPRLMSPASLMLVTSSLKSSSFISTPLDQPRQCSHLLWTRTVPITLGIEEQQIDRLLGFVPVIHQPQTTALSRRGQVPAAVSSALLFPPNHRSLIGTKQKTQLQGSVRVIRQQLGHLAGKHRSLDKPHNRGYAVGARPSSIPASAHTQAVDRSCPPPRPTRSPATKALTGMPAFGDETCAVARWRGPRVALVTVRAARVS